MRQESLHVLQKDERGTLGLQYAMNIEEQRPAIIREPQALPGMGKRLTRYSCRKQIVIRDLQPILYVIIQN